MSCNRQQLNITCGTDVVLHDRLIFEGETFDPNLSVGIAANLVSSLGKRTALDVQVVDDELLISVPWIDGTLPGCYGLEVTGSCNSKKWATYADSLIKYTKATRIGVSEVTVESDSYDITQEVGYCYSNSPVTFAEVTVDDGYGTPSVDVTYEQRVLSMAFHNLKGNGITDIDVDEQVGDEAVNTVTIKTDADQEGTEFQVRNGRRGNGIASSSESLSDEDGGTNTFTITDDDGTVHEFHSKNGTKGSQGDSAVYDPSAPDAPDFVMANSIGDSTTKSMTQKAVTDALTDTEFLDVTDGFTEKTGWFISGENGYYGVNANSKELLMDVKEGDVFLIKANSHWTDVVFLRSVMETPTYSLSDNVGYFRASNGEMRLFTIPTGAKYLGVSAMNSGVDYAPEYVKLSRLSQIESELSNIETEIDNISVSGLEEISKEQFTVYDGAFFGTAVTKYVTAAGCAFKYCAVEEGEKYVIVSNKVNQSTWAFLRSIPQTITSSTDVDFIQMAALSCHQSTVVTIPVGCNYLAVNVSNVYIDIEPVYIGKFNPDKSIEEEAAFCVANNRDNDFSRIICVPIYGQSLAVGGDAPAITTYLRYPKIGKTQKIFANKFDHSWETSNFGLVDAYVDFVAQENHIEPISQRDMIVSFVVGRGSSPIADFVKGTTLYTQLLADITSAYQHNNSGLGAFVVPAFCWIQGEGDLDNGETYYINALSQLREDLDEDIKEITGQTEDVHCILYQTSQLTPGTPPYNPSSYNSGAGGARMDGSVNAQWKLVMNSPYFHLSSPVYPMTFVRSANNAVIHINNISQKALGYYEGLALKRLMDGHGCDIGLYVTNVTKVDSTHIRLSLHVPAPPIVVDTESVYEVPNMGFSVINSNDENIISGVTVERNNFGASTILITTSTDCSGAKLRYGVNGTKGYSGFDKGPRGNIRDSQGLSHEAVVNDIRIPIHNWLMFFEQLIG